MSKISIRRKMFADAIANAGLDLNKDYFALSFDEKQKVDAIRKAFNYSGKHICRSKVQMFWYAAQSAK